MNPLNSQFDEFRKNIEPPMAYKKIAAKADDPVREHLESHDSFAEHHKSTYLYGSYRRQTSILNIKDVDIVVVTNFKKTDDPLEVLQTLRDSLEELYEKTDVADQRRSIRIDRPLPDNPKAKVTLDVIPAIIRNSQTNSLWVPDRDKKEWVASHPQGHISYTSELNAKSGMFVPLAKMMKWWWQHQWELQNPSRKSHERRPKGFWIEVMCGDFADPKPDTYAEMIHNLLANVKEGFGSYWKTGVMPELADPGLDGETIKTSMSTAEFATFLRAIEAAKDHARRALDAKTEAEAANHWRKLFGDKFPVVAEANTLQAAAGLTGALTFPPKALTPSRPAGFA